MSSNRIVLILDQSGSMHTQKNDIIKGVNEMIRQQREILSDSIDEILFTIIKFNDVIEFPQGESETLSMIPFMTNEDYSPRGSTALYDAMGDTINKFREEKNIVVVVATDGIENSSTEYDYKQIVSLVKESMNKQGWKFIYLSEDIDTFKQGNSIGLCNSLNTCGNITVGPAALGRHLTTESHNTMVGRAMSGFGVDTDYI